MSVDLAPTAKLCFRNVGSAATNQSRDVEPFTTLPVETAITPISTVMPWNTVKVWWMTEEVSEPNENPPMRMSSSMNAIHAKYAYHSHNKATQFVDLPSRHIQVNICKSVDSG